MYLHPRTSTALILLTLLFAAPGTALAHGEGPQQTVDGYTVTLALPEKGFVTGQNPIVVSVWDRQANSPEATVSVLLLAYAPSTDGHGATHGETTPDDHATADDHSAPDEHDETAVEAHAAAETEHAHDTPGAIEGRGLAAAPVALTAGHKRGEYQGKLTFDDGGTYTLSVVFIIDGKERGTIFDTQ